MNHVLGQNVIHVLARNVVHVLGPNVIHVLGQNVVRPLNRKSGRSPIRWIILGGFAGLAIAEAMESRFG